MEGIGFSTAYLQIKECCKIGYLFLDTSQAHHSVEFLQTLRVVHSLWCIIRYICCINAHQLLVRECRDIYLLQTFSLFSTYLIKQLTHSTTIGKVLVARIVQLGNHLLRQHLSFLRKLIFLLFGKYQHDLEELLGSIVVDIQEVTEATADTWIDAEKILHFRTIACCDNHKLSTVVFHSLHQLLQCLCTLLVFFTSTTQRSKCIGFVNKQDTSHSLITKTVNHLRSLTLIRTYHLRAVYLHYMTTIKVTYRLQNFAQLTGDSSLTRTRITRQDNMNAYFLLLTKSTLCTLNIIMNSEGYLSDCLLHLIHTNITIEVTEYLLQGAFLWYIAANILFLHHNGSRATTDIRSENILCSLDSYMGIAKGIIFDFHLILEETQQFLFSFWCEVGNSIFTTQFLLTDVT